MEPIFVNKRGLITGVFNKQSIAWAIAVPDRKKLPTEVAAVVFRKSRRVV